MEEKDMDLRLATILAAFLGGILVLFINKFWDPIAERLGYPFDVDRPVKDLEDAIQALLGLRDDILRLDPKPSSEQVKEWLRGVEKVQSKAQEIKERHDNNHAHLEVLLRRVEEVQDEAKKLKERYDINPAHLEGLLHRVKEVQDEARKIKERYDNNHIGLRRFFLYYFDRSSVSRSANLELQKAKELHGEGKTLLEGARARPHPIPNVSQQLSTSPRSANLELKQAKEPHGEGKTPLEGTHTRPHPIRNVPQQVSMAPWIKGMDYNMEKALHFIRDYSPETPGMLGIWGMGGIGKTTLLKQLHHSYTIASFDEVLFIVASKECTMSKIQRDITTSLRLPEMLSVSSQATIIYNTLRDKNFLLLLDDLWGRIDLGDVGIPLPLGVVDKHRRKVILTTRSEAVCANMECHDKIKMECLNEEDAWNLFQDKVTKDIINLDPQIPHLARLVVEECKGLPQALITIGRAMSNKRSPEEWESALDRLKKSQLNQIPGTDKSLYSLLKFSYDNLESDTMRQCFLLCSLWPEDHYIYKDELIECWIGLGLLADFDDIGEAYRFGYSLIGGLQSACLLEHGLNIDTNVKMHDVIRDMALWIASSDCGRSKHKWLVRSGIGLAEIPHDDMLWRTTERVSLMGNDIKHVTQKGTDSRTTSDIQSAEELQGVRLKSLGCWLSTSSDIQRLATLHGVHITSLELDDLQGVDTLELSSRVMALQRGLKVLCIHECRSLEKIIVEGATTATLEDLKFYNLSNLKTIIWKQAGQKLRGIYLTSCRSLRHVTWVQHLRRLEVLYIDGCDELTALITRAGEIVEEENIPTFPRLGFMRLNSLPKLVALSDQSKIMCPVLRVVYVYACPKLRRMPIMARSNQDKIRVACEREWWDRLEWASDAEKSCFDPDLAGFSDVE